MTNKHCNISSAFKTVLILFSFTCCLLQHFPSQSLFHHLTPVCYSWPWLPELRASGKVSVSCTDELADCYTSLPRPSIIISLAFLGLANFCSFPPPPPLLHFTSLEADTFLIIPKGPISIHRANWSKKSKCTLFVTVLWTSPSIYGYFSLLGDA